MNVRTIIIIFIFLNSGGLIFGQSRLNYLFYAGPSITNIHNFELGERQFYISPERPYYDMNYHVGFSIEKAFFSIESLKSRAGILYERRSSSEVAFNKKTFLYGDFLGISASGLWNPTNEKEINIEFGGLFHVLVNESLGLHAIPFRSVEINLLSGIEFKLISKFHIGIRYALPLNYLSGNVESTNPGEIETKQKTQSFQFSLIYKIKNI